MSARTAVRRLLSGLTAPGGEEPTQPAADADATLADAVRERAEVAALRPETERIAAGLKAILDGGAR
jgi:hypothetical protein